jgi:glyoxylase-like metal-dependent hydrolase (beta-lactamase superfamily II)
VLCTQGVAGIPYDREIRFEYGVLEEVAPNVRRLIARNPGPFTHVGTGTYVVGRGRVAVIDPGPDLAEHLDALRVGLQGEEISHILVTHTHRDHSPGATTLRASADAKTHGFGPHTFGPHLRGDIVEAGADLNFAPEVVVRDGDVIEGDGFALEAVHTPGHCENHLCFQLKESRALFTGDQIMAWSTSVIAPPDGNMRDYMRSLQRLADRDDTLYFPTHGAPIRDPKPFLHAYIRHRQDREQQVLSCLRRGLTQISAMVPEMYVGLNPFLIPAACRSVFSHLIDLCEREVVACEGNLALEAHYRLR